MATPLGYRPRLSRDELEEYLSSIHGEAYCGGKPEVARAMMAEIGGCDWTFNSGADFWGLRRFKLTDFIEATGWEMDSVAFPEAAVRYAQRLTDAPPVVCDRLPEGRRRAGGLFLYDGYHRTLAAVLRNDTHIWAYVPLGR